MKTKVLKKLVTSGIATAALASAVSVNAVQVGSVVSMDAYWHPQAGERNSVELILSDQPTNLITINEPLFNPTLALYQAAGTVVTVNGVGLGNTASVNQGAVAANVVRNTLYMFGQGLAFVSMGDWSGALLTTPDQATAAALSFTNHKPTSILKMTAPVYDQTGAYLGMLNDVAIKFKVTN